MKSFYALLLVTTFVFSCNEECNPSERCLMAPPVDLCMAAIPRYYYDQKEKRCKEYTWGGCAEFPFKTLEECKACACNN